MSSWEVWHSSEFDAFPQLKLLQIRNCPKLTGDLPNHLPALKQLDISDCPKLTSLPSHLPALERLEIYKCEQLVSSLPRAPTIRNLEIYESNEVVLQELPVSLQSLSIGGCQLVLESIFQAITVTQPACLQSLSISGCSSAISFPGGCLPHSLRTLTIYDWRKLEFPKQQQHESLRSLQIYNSCDSLTSFPLEIFPNLKNLQIRKCENLQSLSFSESQDAALHSLLIDGCPNFVSFPREGLDAPLLTYFRLFRCDKLKSLPSHMNTRLPKLEHVYISDCPEIDSFPEGGLPPNLRELEISNCENLLRCLSAMEVPEGSLTHLTISGPHESVKSFPKEGLLPWLASLTTLKLYSFSSLETLDCKGLIHLTSLEKLTIEECPKLENMAGERLPASLMLLQIQRSPLLEERCKMKDPQIWPKISHIHGIQVNWEWVS